MKTRKHFREIVVNNKKYLYVFSFPKPSHIPSSIYIFTEKDVRYSFSLKNIIYPENFQHSCWRGKHRDRDWGKREVEYIIKNYLK